MRKVYLCGHTGSVNRGCEAILRSTAKILRASDCENTIATTYRVEDDRAVGLHEVLELMPMPKKNPMVRGISYLKRKIFGDWEWGARFLHKAIFKMVTSEDILFNVGGDTYCYDTPHLSYSLNKMAQEKKIPVVFWGCSVDERILTDKIMQEDLNRYAAIVARETLSYELLSKVIRDKKKLFLACDPAFALPVEPVELPENFLRGNTLGLNVFPLGNRKNALKNIEFFIERVLEQTDMNICLIPHVYNAQERSVDLNVLDQIYQSFSHTGRIAIVEQSLSCTQLKHIISQCRFFVGARTHSMIAAYSTCVPALALSYSIKSRGIAKDILGDESYALRWSDMEDEQILWSMFVEKIMNNEDWIRRRYEENMPDYRNTIQTVCKQVLQMLEAGGAKSK